MYGLADIATRKVERNSILINKRASRAGFGDSGRRRIAVTMRRSIAQPRESVSSSPARFLS
jgi:hypothetical protein